MTISESDFSKDTLAHKSTMETQDYYLCRRDNSTEMVVLCTFTGFTDKDQVVDRIEDEDHLIWDLFMNEDCRRMLITQMGYNAGPTFGEIMISPHCREISTEMNRVIDTGLALLRTGVTVDHYFLVPTDDELINGDPTFSGNHLEFCT